MPNPRASRTEKPKFAWPDGKPTAVSIAYDGTRPEHLTVAVPTLRHYGLRATFFVAAERALEHPRKWRQTADEGHEMASGALLDATADGDLPNWNREAVRHEIAASKAFVEEALGQTCRGFAFPGRSTACADGHYYEDVRAAFAYARTERHGVNAPGEDPYGTRCLRLASWNDGAMERLLGLHPAHPATPSWVVLAFTDLNGGSREHLMHQFALEFLGARAHAVWIAPMAEVAAYAAEARA